MPGKNQIRLICGLIFFCSITELQSNVQANETVTIDLKEGRSVSGDVDARTDDRFLWLRSVTPSVLLISSYQWDKITKIEHGKKSYLVEEFRALVNQLKSTFPEEEFIRSRLGKSRKAVPKLPRVASIEIEATVANWDNDVEVDGLRVVVTPLAADGTVVPVLGNLDVRLFARTVAQGARHHSGTFRQNKQFPELGRWARRVRNSDYGPDGLVYNLPFRSRNAEFDFELATYALANARFSVPGQGSFEASDSMVRLRPYSRFRDYHQPQQGTRFLREEFTRPANR